MGRFNKFYITCTLIDMIDYLSYCLIQFNDNPSFQISQHKLVELHKTCMAAILKALSTVINENRRNKVFTVIKQLKMREFSKDTYFSLNKYIHVIFISTFPQSLMSCILNVVDRQLT